MTGFDNFIQNEEVGNLMQKYKSKEIKTIGQLHSLLNEAGNQVTLRTLHRYVAKLNKLEKHERIETKQMEFKECYTKFDKKRLYLVGERNEWRKYSTTNERHGSAYISCQKCTGIQAKQKNRKPIVAKGIIKEGKLSITNPAHHEDCLPTTLEKLEAEQIDRARRMDITHVNPKTQWRQGFYEAAQRDVNLAKNMTSSDESSHLFNYPTWKSVRRSYNRRRQLAQEPSSSADPVV